MKGETLNHPIQWLYQQHGGSVPSGRASCYLCAVSCPEQYSINVAIADTFNSHYLARAPSSPYLCAACAWYLDNKRGHPDFRKMSLIVEKSAWQNWQRATMKADIVQALDYGLEQDCYLVCSLSKKKHILLQAPLNSAGCHTLAIQVEEQVAHLDLWHWKRMDDCFMRLAELGHNKGEILSGNLYAQTIRKHGSPLDAMDLSRELGPYRNSPALEILSYVTIIDREETNGTTIPNDHDDGRAASAAQPGIRPAHSGLDRNRSGIQEQVPDGHLDAIRDGRSRVRTHDEQPGQVSQSALW